MLFVSILEAVRVAIKPLLKTIFGDPCVCVGSVILFHDCSAINYTFLKTLSIHRAVLDPPLQLHPGGASSTIFWFLRILILLCLAISLLMLGMHLYDISSMDGWGETFVQ